jgi:hypothetical protein
MSQRLGSSLDGFRGALAELLGGADPSQLEFLAFANTITDDFATLNLSRWDVTPVGAFSAVGVKARVSVAPGSYAAPRAWRTCAAAAGGDGRASHLIAKMVFSTPPNGVSAGEAGIHLGDAALGNWIVLGLTVDATAGPVYAVTTEVFILGVSQGLVNQATLGGLPVAIWFHLFQTDIAGTWKAAWSVTGPTSGYTTSPDITAPALANRAGMHLRSIGISIAGTGAVADFDDVILRCPFGTRPLNAYVLLDRALGFAPDIPGARSVVRDIKHGFIDGTFITSRNVLCDDPDAGCDLGPMGGI